MTAGSATVASIGRITPNLEGSAHLPKYSSKCLQAVDMTGSLGTWPLKKEDHPEDCFLDVSECQCLLSDRDSTNHAVVFKNRRKQ